NGEPGQRNGVSVVSLEHKMGLHGSPTAVMQYDNATGWMIGREGGGMAAMFTMMNNARLGVGEQGIGAAEGAYQLALDYALERKQFGKPIGQHQLVQGLLADCQTDLHAGRALLRSTADLLDRDGKAILEASCTKYFCTEMVGRVADRALQIHGGAGYMAEYDIERLYRDVRVLRIYEGTSQIQQTIIAKRTLAGRAA
ncbi:hypothetical protein LCGC14_1724920, partial [marine sediment metagenome]